MTATLTRPPDVTTPTTTRTLASRRDDTIGALFGLALILGILTDAWAHTNILSTLGGFFTPWHGLLYSGAGATIAWTWWLASRHRREDPPWFLNRWPAGYGLGAIGSLLFVAGGAGDMFWHEIFGVEVTLKAALSPSHVTLSVVAILLLVTGQMRSWWASGEGGWRTVTGVTSRRWARSAASSSWSAVVDTVLLRLDTIRGMGAPMRLPIAGAIFAVGIWSGHLIGLRIGAGIHWPPELWAGAVVFSAVIGALLGVLAAGKPADTHADTPARV